MLANDVMKTGGIPKNINETLQIYLSFEERNGFFNSFTFTTLISDTCRHSFAIILEKKKKKSWL